MVCRAWRGCRGAWAWRWGELLGVGEPLLGEDGHLLHPLGVAELGHDVGEATVDLRLDPGSSARSAMGLELDALAAGPAGAVETSTTSADTNGRRSPMAQAWPTSGIILSAASRLAG